MSLSISSYIPTSGGTDARTRDQLSFPLLARPQALTVYLRVIELGSALTKANTRLFTISNAAASIPSLMVISPSGTYRLDHSTASGSVTATAGATPSIGDIVELACQLNPDGSVVIIQSINGGTATTSATSSALTMGTAWSEATIWLNSTGTSAIGYNAFMNIVIVRGVHSLDRMRRYAGVKL